LVVPARQVGVAGVNNGSSLGDIARCTLVVVTRWNTERFVVVPCVLLGALAAGILFERWRKSSVTVLLVAGTPPAPVAVGAQRLKTAMVAVIVSVTGNMVTFLAIALIAASPEGCFIVGVLVLGHLVNAFMNSPPTVGAALVSVQLSLLGDLHVTGVVNRRIFGESTDEKSEKN